MIRSQMQISQLTMNTLNNASQNTANTPPNITASTKHLSPPTTLALPQTPLSLAQQSACSSGVGGGLNVGGANTLNNLKYKFEHLQSNPNTSTRIKAKHGIHMNHINSSVNNAATLPSSTQHAHQLQSTLSFSSSSSLSNFSLSPSSSSSCSSSTSTCFTMTNARSSLVQNQLNILNNKSNVNHHTSLFKKHNETNTSRLNSQHCIEPTSMTITTANLKPIVFRQQKSESYTIPNNTTNTTNNNTSNKRQTFTSSTTTLLPGNEENVNSLNVAYMPSSPTALRSPSVSPRPMSDKIIKKDTNLSDDIELSISKIENSTLMTQNSNNNNNWVPMRNHSVKCNIMLKKMRRGNKRSKSLPAKFSIDSLLEYLNCSMILNKYELKKLHHQRNMMLTNAENKCSTSNLNTSLIASNNNNNNCYNRQRTLLNHHNTYRLNHHHHHHQLSSGYNSENHSNSSNSTTATMSNYQIATHTPQNNNILNFYRLSLNHLPLHHSSFQGPQCTCGAKTNSDINITNSIDNQNKHNNKSHSIMPMPNASSPIHKNSPNNNNNGHDDDEDEEDDEDEDLDDEEEDLDDEEEDDIDENEEVNHADDQLLIDQKSLNILTSSLNLNTNNNNNNKNSVPNISNSINLNLTNTSVNRNYKIIKTSNDSTNATLRLSTQLQRAPGTSTCHHTARIDIRRVRSYRDLTQRQLIYTPHDFVIEEKLGEGFFANVKKITSKQNGQEMVLKELKLSCVPPPPPPPPPLSSESNNGDMLIDSTPKLDMLLNYAELNAAHKSFLKEAQVLRNLSHPNVIKFMGIMFTKEKHLNLILEFISGGTLKDIIHNISNVLPWKLRVGYAQDIAAAMEYLHSLNIIHRDLKSDNCLVRENGRTVVVADFGLSRICNYNSNSNSNKNGNNNVNTITNNNSSLYFIKNDNDSATSSSSLIKMHNSLISAPNIVQSPQSSATNSFIVAAKRKLKRRGDNHQQRKQRYAVVGNSFSMAPEMLKHQIYDERVDIFSFGIICCEIIGRVQADPDYLPRTSDFGLNVELFRKKYCEADCPKHFIKIAIACCELEPEKRPPFSKTHLWLETILSHLETNNPIPKNLLKNILDQNNTKRPISSILLTTPTANNAPVSCDLLNQQKT